MSWIMNLIFGAAVIGSGIREANDNRWLKKQVYETNGIKYYYDRRCRTYELATGREIRVDCDHIEYVNGGVLYDKYQEEAKKSRQEAKENKSYFCFGTCSRVMGTPKVVIHRRTGRQISVVERGRDGKCIMYYFHDSCAEKYPAHMLAYCCKMSKTSYSKESGWSEEISEAEFLEVKNNPDKEFQQCIRWEDHLPESISSNYCYK